MGHDEPEQEIMAEEALKQKLARLKATRRSHRGVMTKYMNDVNKMMKMETLNEHEIESVQNLKKRLELKL